MPTNNLHDPSTVSKYYSNFSTCFSIDGKLFTRAYQRKNIGINHSVWHKNYVVIQENIFFGEISNNISLVIMISKQKMKRQE